MGRRVVRAGVLAAALVTPWCAAPGRALAGECDTKTASVHFEEGKLALKGGDNAAALTAFEAAYRCEPHHVVLYNVAQAQVQLRRYDDALDSLERYLRAAEAAHDLSPERRAEVGAQVQDLRGAIARGSSAAPQQPLAGSVVEDRADVGPTVPMVSLVLGGIALLAAGGATALYLWNDDRYEDWKQIDTELVAAREQALGVAEANAFNELQDVNNERLGSIRTTHIVSIGLGLGALTALSGAVYFWVRDSRATQTALLVTHDEVLFRTSW